MHSFRVWAPLPKKVEVQVGGKRLSMVSGTDGWWTADVPEANLATIMVLCWTEKVHFLIRAPISAQRRS